MLSKELREKFNKFFVDRGHKVMPPSSLVPENDPSVLFTSAGMQQFKGYYLKPSSAPAKRVITIQPCFRTSDIEEVGDESHLTLFEMVGNFSFGYEGSEEKDGAYFKKQTIEWAWEFLTGKDWLNLDPKKFVGTYFVGNDTIVKDEESEEILKTLEGLEKVEGQDQEENFWGPTGLEGPCGPTVEFHYNGLEVWNLVFNEYYFNDNEYSKLEFKGVDTGAGLERLLVVASKVDDVYETDLFSPLISTLVEAGLSDERSQKVVADHVKAAVFAIADGVLPSNKDAGYVVRRLIRRALVALGSIDKKILMSLAQRVVEQYGGYYPVLKKADLGVIEAEVEKWQPVMTRGKKIIDGWAENNTPVTGKMAFDLYQSHGYPIELTNELSEARGLKVDVAGFWKELENHRQVSRAGATQKFKGGLAGHSEIETRYHTATHLLLQALRDVLGEETFQRGANINTERLRFDFSCPQAMTPAQISEVEEMVNEKIAEGLPVYCEEMSKKEAEAKGAVGTFKERYGDVVKIYSIGHKGKEYSMEFCGGPHVENTAQIGKFKITKEESAGAGVRRIRAVLE